MNNLSIITVVRNDFNGIRKTYNSIINLLNHGAKWIVIDGGDDDFTSEWFTHKYEYNIKYIRDDDSGIYDAMNKGLELADNNDYLWFLNSGDQNILDYDLVNSNLLQAKDNDFDIIKFDCTVNGTIRREIINKKFLIFNSPNHQGIFVNKKLHNKFYTDLKLAADYANFVDIYFMNNPNILYVNHSIVEYDLNGITAQQNQKNTIRLERLKSTYRCFKSTKNLFSAFIFLIQFIIYMPFFVFPNITLKRFKD